MSVKNQSLLKTSILKKFVMAVTGIMLSGFLITHLIGNILMYVSAEAFNNYAHHLTSFPLIYVAEAILLLIFVVHIIFALRLIFENLAARPEKYAVKKNTGRGIDLTSSTMKFTGPLILVFMVIHLINFKFGAWYEVAYHGEKIRDLHILMIKFFADPFNIIIYIMFMLLLASHVSHGVWSALQTFGLNHEKYNKHLKTIARLFGVFIFLVFSSFPIWAFLQN